MLKHLSCVAVEYSGSGRDCGSLLSEPEKELRKIRKKLKQIEELKQKQARGEKIEVNQVGSVCM